MATITIPKKEFKATIKESLREVFVQEFMKFRALLLPFVSPKEQKQIEKLYIRPSRKTVKTEEFDI